jgi:TonB family protein
MPIRRGKTSLGPLRLALLLLALGAVPSRALAIVPKPNGADPGPCTITIYWDDTWTGCEEVLAESERGRLLAAAGENATTVMRAWRRRRPDLIVPAVMDTSAAGRAAAANRRAFTDLLRHEMARTFSVDSMAVRIVSDSIGESGAVLRTRYWLARSVRDGRGPITREMGWVDYREDWARAGDRWALRAFAETDELAWEPGTDVSRPNWFPARPGKSVSVEALELTRKADATLAEEADRALVAKEAIPLRTIQPVYPEFAREAQIQGMVVLHVLVKADGTVANVKVVQGVTGLNDAAIAVVRRWTFEPALDHDGNPIEAWTRVPIDFHF